MKFLFIPVAALLLSGCASIMTAEQQSINVTSTSGQPIEVTVDDKKAMTPGTVVVLRDGKDKVVTTSAEGCSNTTLVKKEVATAFWGNIILGGLLGSTTDASTGKMWDYQDNVQVNCAPK